ncbi:MAG: ABC transporter ATP-binding protein [Balneolaceae bacterium]|nr:ABC transporter ATP-binding protein [Balneolaceae bacterium]
MTDNSIILRAQDITKSYASEKNADPLVVLDGVSLEIQHSQITSIVGSSGSGKSTLLHILGGLDSPDSGNVFWGEKNLAKMHTDQLAEFRNKNIGFVFQFHHLLPEFTALENVCMPALIAGTDMEEANDRAVRLLQRFGVENRKSHRPTQLSGGEQQRVSMARAVMNNPALILADEPTGNLDERNTEIILDLLFELRDEYQVSVLLITHEEDIAKRSDTILEMKKGKLQAL